MDYRFKSDEWERLTPSERILRCRTLANEALKLSGAAHGPMKTLYLNLSTQWTKLAKEMERELRPPASL